MLDSIEQSITLVCDDDDMELPNVVRVAAQAVLLLIDKYYSLMKDCELYVIAIGEYYFFTFLSILILFSHVS